jgi:hypothetical protein
MLFLLAALLAFAFLLFWASTGAPLSKREWAVFYAGAALVTLLYQIYVRSDECQGLAECGSSFSKAIAWSAIWPASWLVFLAGL